MDLGFQSTGFGYYSDPFTLPRYGSESTHTLMSYFRSVDLDISTPLD